MHQERARGEAIHDLEVHDRQVGGLRRLWSAQPLPLQPGLVQDVEPRRRGAEVVGLVHHHLAPSQLTQEVSLHAQ